MSPNPRAARQAAGLTQSQAAALIGAALRTWQDWESRRRNMPAIKYAAFCQYVGYINPPHAAPGPHSP